MFEKWNNPWATARVIDDPPVRRLVGDETQVFFLPGDHFTGVKGDWLLDHLALQPGEYRVHLSAYEDSDDLTIFLDGEEIDPQERCEGVPLGPGIDFWKHPVATIGNPHSLYADLFSLTLYRGGSWLMSNWNEVHEEYLPLVQDEEGQDKSDADLGPDIWWWVAEVVKEWASTGVEADMPVVSTFIDASDEGFVNQIALAAKGGRGMITVNGVVVFTPNVRCN